MNVTRQVISDLWPVYTAGEASADTRALVEAFFRQDPEFSKLLQEQDTERMLQQEIPRLPPDQEAKALRRTKRLLLGWDWTLFLAILFSCFAFGRIVADTSWDVSPANFIAMASIAVAFWVAFFVRLFWMRSRVLRTRIGAGSSNHAR
jgi:hypothetical protein